MIDGRNVWKTDLHATLEWLEPIHRALQNRLWLAPSCSLLHVPVDLRNEQKLDRDIYSWLAFALQKLDEAQLNEALRQAPGWTITGGKLEREWTFPDFVTAMQFVNRVAALAEATGHHPDIDIRYSRVRLALISHDAGGITERDADMAKRMATV